MKYLIAIDSDGTLCQTDGSISIETKKAIDYVKSKGHVVVICTSRPRYHTIMIADSVKSSEYIISSNGGEIYNYINGEVIWHSCIDYDTCVSAYRYAALNKIRIIFVVDNLEYVTMYVKNDNQRILNDLNYESVLRKNVKQIVVFEENKIKLQEFKKEIMFKYNLNITDSFLSNEDNWFCINGDGVSKGNAILKLANYLNIEKENIIAIGNDKNDISMLEIAGVSVVMDNASDEVKKYANVVTKSNDLDGVAIYLKENI